jgi:hypothetical protein
LLGDVCEQFVTTAKIAVVLVRKPVPHESQNYTLQNLSKLYGLLDKSGEYEAFLYKQ